MQDSSSSTTRPGSTRPLSVWRSGFAMDDCAKDILNGIEHAPGAIAGLYRGENTGKRLIKIR